MMDTKGAQEALRQATQDAAWAGIRFSREVTATRQLRNDLPEGNQQTEEVGAMCEVLVDGQFGYAATADTSADGLQTAFARALERTRLTSAHRVHVFSPTQRPALQGQFVSPARQTPAAADLAQIQSCLQAACAAMKGHDEVVNRSARATTVQTDLAYLSSSGADLRQHFDMVSLELAATAAQGAQSQTRTWMLAGQMGSEAFDVERCRAEGRRIADEARELLHAPNCPTGVMDLILMPDQMMLQIHESIGHPLELDRILGDERNYAGWSFVQPHDFGRLQYGSELMNVSFDPGVPHEMASYAYDDGGNPARRELLIERGVLRRGLGSLESQTRSGLPGVANFRSASWNRAPIDRMANINLEPGTASLEELIAQVEDGILMSTNRSWSIDDYRNKFQFGCERGLLIRGGKLAGVVRDPNYRGVTVDFWRRLAGVGAAREVHGTLQCGKGEPNQLIRVGHASPPCLFRAVQVFGGEK